MSTIEKPGESREILPEPDLRIVSCRVRGVEVRTDTRDAQGNADGAWTMSGYAAVFDTDAVLYDGAYFQMVESVDPGAFDRALAEADLLTHFNFGHDMNRAMASTAVPQGQVGSLSLRVDREQGLHFLARVDPADPDAQALAVKMRSGVINGASFAFTIARKQLTTTDMEDGREQDYVRILEVGELYDVCACAQGAYPTASSNFAARAYGAAMLGLNREPAGQPARESGEAVSPETGVREVVSPETGVGSESTRLALPRLRAAARSSRTLYPLKDSE
jgi:HK97 family phage prohead protease